MQAAVLNDVDLKDKIWAFVGKYLGGATDVATTARWGDVRISDMSESALLSCAAEFISKSDLLCIYKALGVEPNKLDLTSKFVAHLLSHLVSLEKKRKRKLPSSAPSNAVTEESGAGDSSIPAKKSTQESESEEANKENKNVKTPKEEIAIEMAKSRMQDALKKLNLLGWHCESQCISVFDDIQCQARLLHPDWDEDLKEARMCLVDSLHMFPDTGRFTRDILIDFLKFYKPRMKVAAALNKKYHNPPSNFAPRNPGRGFRPFNSHQFVQPLMGRGRGFQNNPRFGSHQVQPSVCFFCGVPGHVKADCHKFKAFRSQQNNSGSSH